MRSYRRVTQRVAPALASVASVLLFATCDFDKISGTPTPLTQGEIDLLFSITPADTTVLLGGTTTLNITPGAGVDLSGIAKEWTSSAPTVVAINSTTGVATGVSIGNATIKARILAPELDTGYSKTRALRVRYKAIKACGLSAAQCSPATLDSIAGLNLSRPVNFFGTNSTDAIQTTNLNATTTITAHDSGSTATTVASVTSNNVFARKNGVAYVVGVFESMRDSIKVKVRQVAKSLTFPTTDYVANSLNANRTVPLILKDVNDSTMLSSPLMRWRSSDTTVFTIDSITGVLRVKKLDTARVFVRVDTILNRSQKLRVDQALASLTKFLGDVRSDTVARAVTVLPTVQAVDSGNVAIAGDTVIFRVGTGGGVITDSVKITDASGQAAVGSWQLGTIASPQTLIATSGGKSATFTVTGLPQRAFKLGFAAQPKSSAVNAALTPAVTVSIRDSLSNLVNTATDSVFLAIGNNPGTATLGGVRRAAAVNGVATFSNLTLSASGSGYTLQATGSGSLAGAVSDAFDIFGAATKLAVIRQPVGTSIGAIMDTVQIAVQDAAGNVVANDTRIISLAIGTNPSAGTLSGTTSVAAVAGIATFTGLSINAAGNGYTLSSTATGLTGATSNSFNMAVVGPAAKLAFTTQPGTTQSGATPSVAVTIQDANGATVASSAATVTLALSGGPSGSSLSGTASRTPVNGVVTFPGISVNLVGSGYKLTATSSGLSPAESNPFSVTPGAATKLGFIAQPTHSVVSTTMAPAVTVAIQDAAGNTVTSQAPTAVTVAAQTCTGGTISGTTSVNTASGVATFSGISIGATQASGCTLLATSTGLTNATSSAFNMVASTGAIRLVFGTQPTQTTAGNSIASFTVRAVDASGNTVTTSAPGVTLTVLSGPGTIFTGSGSTAVSGVATFSTTQLRTAGSYKLLATSTGFKADSSIAFTIVPGSLSKLGFVQQPSSITAGVPFSPAVSVAFQDQYGNTVPSQTGAITLNRNQGPSNHELSGGPLMVEAASGVATFPGLTLKVANLNYNLVAGYSAGALSAFSNTFSVTAGPLSALTFTNAPTSNTAGTTFGATVQATDSVGNAISAFNGQITLGLTGGNPAATLLGTTAANASGGFASFAGLSIQKSGTGYQLSASASGVSTATSAAFAVSAAAAAKLGWLTQPTATFLNAPLAPGAATQPQIAIQDAFGNTNTSFTNSTVRLVVNTGPSTTFKSASGNVTLLDILTTNGVATLPTTMAMTTIGSYTMLAQSPFNGFTQAASNSFAVTANDVKAKLAFTVQPANATTAVAINPAVEVTVQDAYGNTVPNATDQITIAKGTDGAAGGGTTLSGGAAAAAVAGVAKFSLLTLDKVGTAFTLQATATGLTSATSGTFNVTSPGNITGPSNIADMTIMGGQIYWLEAGATGALKSTSVSGGPVTTYSGFAIANAARIANDGTNLYWIEAGSGAGTGSVRRYNPAVGGTPVTLAQSLSNVRFEANTFAVDASNVYFVGTNAASTLAAIRSVPANAASAQTPSDLFSAAGTASSHYFTVSGSNIYFQDASAGAVKRITTTGGTPVTLTVLGINAQRLVVGGTTLYFSEGGNVRTVLNANTAATAVTPATPVASLNFVYNMVLEGNNLYMKTGNTVRRYDVTTFGGTATSADLATNGLGDYEALLLDTSFIYYSTFTAASIGKVQK